MVPRFGTDGVRGTANSELTPEWALGFGRVAARVLSAHATAGGTHGDTGTGRSFVIGRDTRISGSMLSAAMAAGIASEGVDVIDVGIMTTPGVAWIAAERGIPGAVISASHNPYADNGVKLFAVGGSKLSDSEQLVIEDSMEDPARPASGPPGNIVVDGTANYSYLNHLVASLEGRHLDGMRVVVDCANGAASNIAPEVIRMLGADVVAIGVDPNGRNINDGCGSTYPEALQKTVVERRADLGLAFDGDADRVIAVDDTGAVVDGDHLIALFARDLHSRDKLFGGGVVVTVMTNLGFRIAMSEAGISVVEVDVGDRNILRAFEETGLILGGEQSGHIVFRNLATTGDGILSGIQLLDLVSRNSRPLSTLAAQAMTRLPQHLTSIEVADTSRLGEAREVWELADTVSNEFAGKGRVLIRASGTEPKIRVMVEATSEDAAQLAMDRLCDVVERAFRTA